MHQCSTDTRKLFLMGQELRELAGVPIEERQFHVCGGISGKQSTSKPPAEQKQTDPWTPIARSALVEQAAGKSPRRRVALVCDSGRGKTTNMRWLRVSSGAERRAGPLAAESGIQR